MENCNFQETYFVSAKNKGFLRNSLFRIVIQFKESKNVVFFLTRVSWIREKEKGIKYYNNSRKPLAIAKECKVGTPKAVFALNVLQFQRGI